MNQVPEVACNVGAPIRLAYFTNAYPKVSHSFIRREIAALEELGAEVLRISIRRTTDALPDSADRLEGDRTITLLGSPGAALGLAGAVFARLLRSPGRFFATAGKAISLARGSSSGLLRHLAYLAEACSVAQLLEARGIRHVHVHFGTNPTAVAYLVKALSGVSYSFTVHGPDEFDNPRGLKLREKIADAAMTFAISSYGRGQLMRWAAVADWNRIEIVRCGLDKSYLAAEQSAPSAAPRLLCVARLSGQKGVPLLLQAAAAVRRRGLAFELRIAGDGELRNLLEQEIARLGLADTIVLLGWQSAEQIRAELEACRAFVLPSFAEGLPVVLMEALAMGRPVLTTAIAGIPELVDGECGWLFPSGSVEHCAEAMIAALEAFPDTLARMGRSGRERVLAQHDAHTNAQSLLNHWRPLLEPAVR